MSNNGYIKEIFSSIQGEGYLAGRRQIFIRMTECNLDCCYCDTVHVRDGICTIETSPGSGIFQDIPQPLPLQTILNILNNWCQLAPGAHHSVSITGGEPLLHAETLSHWLPAIRQILPIHLETNGTMPLALQQVINHLDYISMDMKLPSTSGCTEKLWEMHRDFLCLAHSRCVSVKVVIGENTTEEEIRMVCGIIADVEPATPLFLQPLTLTTGKAAIKASHIMLLQEVAAALLPDVRVIPQMHLILGAL